MSKNREEAVEPLASYLAHSQKALGHLWQLHAKIHEQHESRDNDVFKFNVLGAILGHSAHIVTALTHAHAKED